MNTGYFSKEISRTPLNSPDLGFGEFNCTNVSLLSDCGASGLVYEGYSYDYYGHADSAPARLIIKECYPLSAARGLTRRGDKLILLPTASRDERATFNDYIDRFLRAFDRNVALYQSRAREQISVPSRAIRANGTIYIVNNASNGDTLDIAFPLMGVYQRVETLTKLCETLAAIHAAGFVHLDLKPENILCVLSSDPHSSEAYYSEIRLFDFDTVTAIADLGELVSAIPSSGDWSSFEQTHTGHEAGIGMQSDVYSIGALLFWSCVGRPPTSNEVIHAHGNWQITPNDLAALGGLSIDNEALHAIGSFFNKTLTVDPRARFGSASEAAAELKRLGELVMPENKTMAVRFNDLAAGQNRLEEQLSQLMGLMKLSSTPVTNPIDLERSIKTASPMAESPAEAPSSTRSPDVNVFEIASTASLMAGQLSKIGLVGVPDSLRVKLSEISSSTKKALEARDKNALVSISEKAEAYCAAAMALAASEAVGLINGYPEALIAAKQEMTAGLLDAIDADDFQRTKDAASRLESSLPLFVKGTELAMAHEAMKDKVSATMHERVDGALRKAAGAISSGDKASIASTLSELDALADTLAEDAYMGMLSNLI